MDTGPETLTPDQQQSLTIFREVTANASGDEACLSLLRSCGWNVEQALQLHWAAGEEDVPRPHATGSSLTVAPGGDLAAPLLRGGPAAPPIPDSVGDVSDSSIRVGILGWIIGGLKKITQTVFNVFCTFLFGVGSGSLGGGVSSGAAFSQALQASYGSNLNLPTFFEGGFSTALQAAQRDLKILVVFLHSENARDAHNFVVNVLCNELVRTMLNENYMLWGGDVARMETHYVSQMVRSRQYPSFCVLLPVSVEEVRVIGMVQGDVQVDAAISLLAACYEEMDTHRSEIAAMRAQQVEDRHLREEQDREYQEALEMDRLRSEEKRRCEQQEREAERLVAEEKRKQDEELRVAEAEREAVVNARKAQAETIECEGPDATARVALRLPAGQRAQRRFRPTATLADVYAWAGCVGHLPENDGRGLEIPKKFVLKTAFPCRDLSDMDATIQELELSGTNLVLAEIEDD